MLSLCRIDVEDGKRKHVLVEYFPLLRLPFSTESQLGRFSRKSVSRISSCSRSIPPRHSSSSHKSHQQASLATHRTSTHVSLWTRARNSFLVRTSTPCPCHCQSQAKRKWALKAAQRTTNSARSLKPSNSHNASSHSALVWATSGPLLSLRRTR